MKALAALLMLTIPVTAHVGDRVFSIPYLSADDLAYMELDGDLTDWKELFVEPTLTALDFNMYYHPSVTSYAEYDPGNLDFRIWMGWADGGKIYVAAEAADDVYKGIDEQMQPSTPNGFFYTSDHVVLMVDGDHSGGEYIYIPNDAPDVRNNAQAQYYEAISYSEHNRHGLVSITFAANRPWMGAEPYALGSGTVLGENPTFWTVEFYVTAFDDVFSPEDFVISSFEPGQIIGFDVVVFDWDRSETRNAQFYLSDPTDEDKWEGAYGFTDAILLGPEGTAVESTSWARIKATLTR